MHAQRHRAHRMRWRPASLSPGDECIAGEAAHRQPAGVGAAQGRRRGRGQRDQHDARDARDGRAGREGPPRDDLRLDGPRQGAPAEHAARRDHALHDADHAAVHGRATHRAYQHAQADVQYGRVERAGPEEQALLQWRGDGSGVSGLADLRRTGAQYHRALYADRINWSFTACRSSLPHVQRLAVYTGEAVDELEEALSGTKKRGRKAA